MPNRQTGYWGPGGVAALFGAGCLWGIIVLVVKLAIVGAVVYGATWLIVKAISAAG